MEESILNSIKEEIESNLANLKKTMSTSQKLLNCLKDYENTISKIYNEVNNNVQSIQSQLTIFENNTIEYLQKQAHIDDNTDIIIDEQACGIKKELKKEELFLKKMYHYLIIPSQEKLREFYYNNYNICQNNNLERANLNLN